MFPSDIEKFKFRLGSVISGLASLKSLKAKILEPTHILTDQILGAFGPKLKEIEITGPLKEVTKDAFEGVENNYELLLAIRNTDTINFTLKPRHSVNFNPIQTQLNLPAEEVGHRGDLVHVPTALQVPNA